MSPTSCPPHLVSLPPHRIPGITELSVSYRRYSNYAWWCATSRGILSCSPDFQFSLCDEGLFEWFLIPDSTTRITLHFSLNETPDAYRFAFHATDAPFSLPLKYFNELSRHWISNLALHRIRSNILALLLGVPVKDLHRLPDPPQYLSFNKSRLSHPVYCWLTLDN